MRPSSPTILRSPLPPASSLSGYAALLWLLSGLFGLRVAGQAIQHWIPSPALPPLEAFQGSGLPYALLLSVQLVILIWMGHLARQVSTRR